MRDAENSPSDLDRCEVCGFPLWSHMLPSVDEDCERIQEEKTQQNQDKKRKNGKPETY